MTGSVTTSFNETTTLMVDLLNTNIGRSQNLALYSFVSIFAAICTLIVIQFVVSIQSLGSKNYR